MNRKIAILAAVMALGSGMAFADSNSGMGGGSMGGGMNGGAMHGNSMNGGTMTGKCTHYRHMGNMTGVHVMGGTVESVDHHSGMLNLKTAEGMLRLHFPPKSLAHVKNGEKIKVHLGFSPEG